MRQTYDGLGGGGVRGVSGLGPLSPRDCSPLDEAAGLLEDCLSQPAKLTSWQSIKQGPGAHVGRAKSMSGAPAGGAAAGGGGMGLPAVKSPPASVLPRPGSSSGAGVGAAGGGGLDTLDQWVSSGGGGAAASAPDGGLHKGISRFGAAPLSSPGLTSVPSSGLAAPNTEQQQQHLHRPFQPAPVSHR